jgi:predicted nucleic acid-binding protein
MIVLDTNVLSALMQAKPERRVVAWLDSIPAESVWITAINVFEVRFGLELLVAGRRRRDLEAAFDKALEEGLGGRLLAFDEPAAQLAGRLAAQRRVAGRPVEMRDLQIAAIVGSRRGTLATRNTRHFADLGIALVDPWQAGRR